MRMGRDKWEKMGKGGIRVVEPVCLVLSRGSKGPKNRGARQSPPRVQA